MSIPRLGSSLPAIDLAINRMSGRMFAADDYSKGCFPYWRPDALAKRHVQFNRKHNVSVLIFDVDRCDAGLAWERHGLPPPTWIATNRDNGHAHLAYVLDTPVLRTYEKSRKPVWLLEVVTKAMTAALDADRSYQHFLTKNPLHPDWSVVAINKTYSLPELCDWIPDRFLHAASSQPGFSIAGDASLEDSSFPRAFQICRNLMYRNWRRVAQEMRATGRSGTLEDLTMEALADPSTGELRLKKEHARQVIQRVSQWAEAKYDEKVADYLLRERQSRRGKKSARVRRDARGAKIEEAVRTLREAGMAVTQKAVADLAGCCQSLISKRYRHLLVDRPAKHDDMNVPI